jgi:tRNA(His) 5'-end guanylyltransferase
VKNHFKKPFDEEFIEMMNDTAKFVCKNVQGVKVAYVQSDEISLLIWKSSPDSEIFFGGRLCKLQSIIAAFATSEFNRLFIRDRIFNMEDWSGVQISDLDQELCDIKLAQFDCKAWNVDTIDDAYLWLLFRNIDCVRNSKQQAAQTYISSKELNKVNTDDQVALLKEKTGIDWKDYPEDQKYGRIIIKKKMCYKNTDTDEIYDRRIWSVEDGLDLTDATNRDTLRAMVEKSEQECKTNEG